jgi:dCMP deaminase
MRQVSPRLSRDQWLMGIADQVSARGTCSRAQVGAIIVRDSRMISTGYNGVPAGMLHCDHTCRCDIGQKHLTYGSRAFPPECRGLPVHDEDCPAERGCDLAVHAEANAIAFAARHGAPVHDCELFTTHQPCLDCAKLIINAGIVRVVFWKPYRRPEGLDLLNAASVRTMKIDPAASWL